VPRIGPTPGSFKKGRAKTGGRQKGAANERTREIADQAAAYGLTPLEYMLSVLRDPTVEPERRDRMAVAAAPFVHPRLASVEAKVDTFGQLHIDSVRSTELISVSRSARSMVAFISPFNLGEPVERFQV
jgi:hypothetical protein